MSYIDGFVAAVPTANEAAYREHAAAVAALFLEFGATRCVECWGDDVKDGHTTDFRRAVKAGPDESVVFAWIEHPDKPTRDAAMARIMEDPRMREMAMPFDGKRMIYGGFRTIVDDGAPTRDGYVDGFIVPVPRDREEPYRALAEGAVTVFRDHGMVRLVEAWQDDVPKGEVTDFFRATKAEDDEVAVFSWCEWPSRDVRDAGQAAMIADERMHAMPEMPFDGKRMVTGGFRPILDLLREG